MSVCLQRLERVEVSSSSWPTLKAWKSKAENSTFWPCWARISQGQEVVPERLSLPKRMYPLGTARRCRPSAVQPWGCSTGEEKIQCSAVITWQFFSKISTIYHGGLWDVYSGFKIWFIYCWLKVCCSNSVIALLHSTWCYGRIVTAPDWKANASYYGRVMTVRSRLKIIILWSCYDDTRLKISILWLCNDGSLPTENHHIMIVLWRRPTENHYIMAVLWRRPTEKPMHHMMHWLFQSGAVITRS